MEVEERIVDMGVCVPVGEVKFDAHTARASDQHPDELSRILDDLEEDCFACIACLQGGILRTSFLRLGARAAKLAEEYNVLR